MANFRWGVINLASLLLVYLPSHVRSADPNVVPVPGVDGFKLTCPTTVPEGTSVNWKGPAGTQLNFENGTFADTRLSYIDGKDLQMANATPADNGNYVCDVGGVEATIVLMVYVKAPPKLMMSFNEEIWDSSRGFYQIQGNESEAITITCMIKGAFPQPTVSLTIMNYNNSLLSTIPSVDVTISSNLETDNTYSVNATATVTLEYVSNNRRFDCNALFDVEGTTSTSTHSARFFLLEVRPTLFVFSGLKTLTPTDNTVTLSCYTRCRPGIEAVTFFIDGAAISAPFDFTQSPVTCTEITEINKMYSYLLGCEANVTISGLTKMHNGVDTGCTYTYKGQTFGSATGNNQRIDFRFPPTMVNITGNMPIQISGSATQSLTLTCATDSSNGVSTLTWYKGGVQTNSTDVTLEADGMYGGKTVTQNFMVNVDRSMDGHEIKCEAENFYNFRNPLSASVMLNVSFSPMLIQPTANIYRVYSGEQLMVSCFAEAKPMATTKWMKVNSPTNKTEVTSVITQTNGNTQLHIQTAEMAHAGDYECQATNSISPDDSKMIKVIVLDKSSQAPFDVTTMTPSATSVMFEFTLPSDRVLQSLSLRYFSVMGSGGQTYVGEIELVLPASGNKVSATVTGLMPETDYLFQLRETDAAYGLVSNTFLQQVKTSPPEEDKYTKSDVTTAILISVFVTAAVVAIICVAIFCIIRRSSSSSRGDSNNEGFREEVRYIRVDV